MRKGQAWFDAKDHPHHTLPQCQIADLTIIGFDEATALRIVQHIAEVLNVLHVTPRSHLRARKLNGGKRKPRATEQSPLPNVCQNAPETTPSPTKLS